MFTRSADSRQPDAWPSSLLGGWFLLILFIQSACATGTPRGSRLVDDRYEDAKKSGEDWLARLLEREARGRHVHARLKAQFEGPFQFKHQGVDIVAPTTGRKYEILSGTESNLARHGRRMASEFFRMLTF